MSLPRIEIIPVTQPILTIKDIPEGHLFTSSNYGDTIFFKMSSKTIVAIQSTVHRYTYAEKYGYEPSHEAVDLGTFDDYINNKSKGADAKLVSANNLPYGTVVDFRGNISHIVYATNNYLRIIQSLENSLNNWTPTETNLVEVIGTLKVTK